MVITAHFVDLDWNLQKRVINFVHLPLLCKGVNIADCILTCLREWEIEDKFFTIYVDNASANDSCIAILKDNFESNGRLICGGKLFYVRCCAHILNIMVQHDLQQVKDIIVKVHYSFDYSNSNDARLKCFGEPVSQYNMNHRKDDSGECEFGSNICERNDGSSGLPELLLDVFSGETSVTYVKSELDIMAANIFSVPITTVASETTFSAGGRAIDPYRASFASETVY
ncbi:zinc finger BED domain-containing protein RICESLEEPER 2-like [Cynara cardunculus var. scolymus]|uniref:zinc finger BED domain-containing protein RICESLEEPER 2-like n=1 Tax=Cynara cardunculus var. scolymus TaxID=59895 RepID=UPI000D6250C6|nr:zinc finger BED domain-containing protein RICESLEEPER 2-like [Cynara cardunculus var. scolymus]